MYCIQHLNGASVERCTIHRQYDIHGCTEEDWRACLCTVQPIISFSKRVLLCWLSNTDTSSYSVWRIFSPFTFILSKKKKKQATWINLFQSECSTGSFTNTCKCNYKSNYYIYPFHSCSFWSAEEEREVEAAQTEFRQKEIKPGAKILLPSFVPASRARNRVHINLTEAWIHSHVKSTFSAIHCKQFKTLPDGKRQACRHLSLQSLSGIFKEPLNLPD